MCYGLTLIWSLDALGKGRVFILDSVDKAGSQWMLIAVQVFLFIYADWMVLYILPVCYGLPEWLGASLEITRLS